MRAWCCSAGTSPARRAAVITLRAVADSDIELFRSLYGDRDVMALVGGPLGSDECDRIFGAALRGERAHFRVIEVDGCFVGVIGLVMRTDGQHELGMLLRSDRQRRGVGRRAVDAFVDEVRCSGPTTRILIGHRAENRGMARLVEYLTQRFSCAPLGRGEAAVYWVLDLTQELLDAPNSRGQ